MQDKLQELTEKLYNEGLSKGRQEGEQILAKAQKEAEAIVAEARAQAAAISAKAEKEAEDLRSKVASDLKMASAQTLQATKKDIENLLVGKISAEPVAKALEDPSFLKEIISAVAGNFSSQDPVDISLVLPEKLRKELAPWVSGELAKSLGKGVSADFSKKVGGGFQIGPKDGSWFVSLTEDTFKELIAEYLRPVTRNLLFGE